MARSFKTPISVDGNITTNGIINVTSSAGIEGGEIRLAAPAAANTSINTSVTIDVYENKIRFFETGGTNRGYYIDLTAGGATVGTNLVSGGGGSSLIFGPIVKTGYYYSSLGTDSSSSVALASAVTGNLDLQPFYIGATATAIRIAVSVTSATVSGSVRLLIYSNASGGDYPGSLLLNAGTVSTATAGSKVITISQSLSAGLYWIGYMQVAGTGSTVLQGVSSGTGTGSGAAAMSFAVPSFTTASVTGVQNLAWRQVVASPYTPPTTFSGTTLLSTVGSIWLGF